MSRIDESTRPEDATDIEQTKLAAGASACPARFRGKRVHARAAGWGFAATVGLTMGLAACSPASQPDQAPSEAQSEVVVQSEATQSAGSEPSDEEVAKPDAEDENEDGASEHAPAETAPDTSTWELSSAFSPGVQPETSAVVTGMRVAQHAGYDRVVLDLTGSGPIGWQAYYTDVVVGQGKGDPLPLEGSVYLNVDVTGVSIPVSAAERAAYYAGQEAVGGSIVTAWYDSTYEGRAQVAIAMDRPRPFQVFTLSDPLRVVVDIATD